MRCVIITSICVGDRVGSTVILVSILLDASGGTDYYLVGYVGRFTTPPFFPLFPYFQISVNENRQNLNRIDSPLGVPPGLNMSFFHFASR